MAVDPPPTRMPGHLSSAVPFAALSPVQPPLYQPTYAADIILDAANTLLLTSNNGYLLGAPAAAGQPIGSFPSTTSLFNTIDINQGICGSLQQPDGWLPQPSNDAMPLQAPFYMQTAPLVAQQQPAGVTAQLEHLTSKLSTIEGVLRDLLRGTGAVPGAALLRAGAGMPSPPGLPNFGLDSQGRLIFLNHTNLIPSEPQITFPLP